MPRVLLRKPRGTSWGLNLRRATEFPQGAFVAGVSDVSPAKSHGLKEGDVIVSINGNSLAGIDIQQIQQFFMSADVADLEYLSQPLPANSNASASRSQTTNGGSTTTSTGSGMRASTSAPVIDLISSEEEEEEEEDEEGEGEEVDQDVFDRAHGIRSQPRVITHFQSSGRRASVEVIDLVSDDDEPPEPPRTAPRVGDNRSASLATPSSSHRVAAGIDKMKSSNSKTPAPSAVKNTTAPTIPVLTAHPTDGPVSYPYKLKYGKIEIKIEYEPKRFGEANIGDEVVELPNPKQIEEENGMDVDENNGSKKRNFTAAFDDDDDGEIQIIGEKMTVASDMPHQREACTRNTFKYNGTKGNQVNYAHCPNCYCYICEVKAGDCMDWVEHCNANCRDVKWKQLRSTHNTPMMKLLSPSQKTSFLKKYEGLFSQSQNANAYDSEDDDDEEDDDDPFGYGHMFGFGSGYPSYLQREKKNLDTITTCVNNIRGLLNGEGSKVAAKSSSSSSSEAKASQIHSPVDDYMEASALLIRLLGLSNLNSKIDSIKSLLIQWIVHPMHTTALHDALKKTLEQHPHIFGSNFTRSIHFLPSFIKDPNGKRGQMKTELLDVLNAECLKFIFLRVVDKADEETVKQIITVRSHGDSTSTSLMLLFVIAKTITLEATHRIPLVEQILINIDEATLSGYLKSEASSASVDYLTLLKVLAITLDVFRLKKIQALKVGSIFLPLLRIIQQKNASYDDLDRVRCNFQMTHLFNNQTKGITWLHSLLSSPVVSSSTISTGSTGIDWRDCLQFTMAFLGLFCEIQVGEMVPTEVYTSLNASIKKVAAIEHHLACWLCANVIATYFHPKIPKLTHQQAVVITDSFSTLMSFFFSMSFGKSHIKFYTQMHPWILHSYTRMPTIITMAASPSAISYIVQSTLSNVPDALRFQVEIKEKNKTSLMKEIFKPMGAFTSNRQFVIGNYLSIDETCVMLKLVTTLVVDARGGDCGFPSTSAGNSSSSANVAPLSNSPEAFNTMYQIHRFLFMMIWKSIYLNFFIDLNSVGAFWSDAANKFSSLFRCLRDSKQALDWLEVAKEIDEMQKQEAAAGRPLTSPLGTDLERRIFFYNLGFLQKYGAVTGMPAANSSPVRDVVGLKKDILAFSEKLSNDIQTHSQLPSYEISMRLAVENFYVTAKESATSIAAPKVNIVSCIWDEWKLWSSLICCVARQNNDDRLMVKLVVEDFTDLSSLATQWQKLSDFSVEDLDWAPQVWPQNLTYIAKALQEGFSTNTSASNPFLRTKEVNFCALSKPNSILNKCMRYMTIDFLQRHTDGQPIVHKVIAELCFSTAGSPSGTLYHNVFKALIDEANRKRSLFLTISESTAVQAFDLIQSMAFLGQSLNIPPIVKSKDFLKSICTFTAKARKNFFADKDLFVIMIRQVLLNIQDSFMGGFIQFFEDQILEHFVTPSFHNEMKEVTVAVNKAFTKNRNSKDSLYLALFNFYSMYDETSFVEFWSLLCDLVKGNYMSSSSASTVAAVEVIDTKQFIDKITHFCELMKSSAMEVTPNTWKTQWLVMYHMKGLDGFLQYIVNSPLKEENTDIMIEQLIVVVVEKVFQLHGATIMQQEAYQDLIMRAVCKCLLALPGVGKDLRRLLSTLPAELSQPKIPVITNNADFSSPTISKTFAQLLINSLQDTTRMPEHVRTMAHYVFYSTCKEQVFACLSDPSDPGVTLNLMLSNRMFVGIGDYLKKRAEFSNVINMVKTANSSVVGSHAMVKVQPVAIAMDMLTSLIQPHHLMPTSSGSPSNILNEELVMAELHSPSSLLRSLYKCCAYLQLRYCGAQQPPDGDNVKVALQNLKKALSNMLKSCVKHSRLLTSFIDCFADIFQLVEFCGHYHSYCVLLNRPPHDLSCKAFCTDILQIGDDANYLSLIRYVLMLLQLRSNTKKLLETWATECSSEDLFHDFIGTFFAKACTFWYSEGTSSSKEYRLPDGLMAVTHRYVTPASSAVKEIETFLSAKQNELLAKPLYHPIMLMFLGFNPNELPAEDRSVVNLGYSTPAIQLSSYFGGSSDSVKHHFANLLKKLGKIDNNGQNNTLISKNSRALSAMMLSLSKAYWNENASFDLNAFLTNAVTFQQEKCGLTWLMLMIALICHGSPQTPYGRSTSPSSQHPLLLVRLLLFNSSRNPKVFPAIIHHYLLQRLKSTEPYLGQVTLVDAPTSPTNTIATISKYEILACPEVLDMFMLQSDGHSSLDMYAQYANIIAALCEIRPMDGNLVKKFQHVLIGLAEAARSTTMDARRRTYLDKCIQHLSRAKRAFASNGFADQLQATKTQMIKIVKSKKAVVTSIEGL